MLNTGGAHLSAASQDSADTLPRPASVSPPGKRAALRAASPGGWGLSPALSARPRLGCAKAASIRVLSNSPPSLPPPPRPRPPPAPSQPHLPPTGSAGRRTPRRRCRRRSRGAAPLRRRPRRPARGLGVPGRPAPRRRPRGWRHRRRAPPAAARTAAPRPPGCAPAAAPSLRTEPSAGPLGPLRGRRGRGAGTSPPPPPARAGPSPARSPRSRGAASVCASSPGPQPPPFPSQPLLSLPGPASQPPHCASPPCACLRGRRGGPSGPALQAAVRSSAAQHPQLVSVTNRAALQARESGSAFHRGPPETPSARAGLRFT